MTTATKTASDKATSKPAAATVAADALTGHVSSAMDTCRDLALKGFEAQRQVVEAMFAGFNGYADPFEIRSRSHGLVEGMISIAESGVKDSTELARGYVKGLAAASSVDAGTPKDFAEVGTRIEKTVGDLTGLNRSTTEQVIEMTTRQAKGFEALVRESLPATAVA